MRSKKRLLLEQLDRKTASFENVSNIQTPAKGWVYTVRTALNMTLDQLGKKLNITKQGVLKLEKNEAAQSITLKSLHEIAEALDLKLVYGFVPKSGSFDQLVEEKARELAKKVVQRTHQNMLLEDQAIYGDRLDRAIEDLTQELKQQLSREIWD